MPIQSGNASNIIVKDAGNSWFRGLAMYYGTNEQLWRVLWDQWEGGVRGPFNSYTILGSAGDGPAPREFYYNGMGGRYLSRQMYITGSAGNYDWDVLAGQNSLYVDEFTDTLGLTPTSDFTSRLRHTTQEIQNPPLPPFPILTAGDKYLNDAGLLARERPPALGGAEEYWHGDLVGSTNRLTDSAGAQTPTAVRYTAFGEVVTGSQGIPPGGIGGQLPSQFPRYGYVGEYGYESDMLVLAGASGTKPIILSHVGARWHEPSIGRFVQRDPIGVKGGANVYAYVENDPLAWIDPDGKTSWWPNKGQIRYGPSITLDGVKGIAFRYRQWHAFGIAGAACFLGTVVEAAAVGVAVGTVLVDCTPIEDWIGAPLAPIVGPGTGPGIPAPPPYEPEWPPYPALPG